MRRNIDISGQSDRVSKLEAKPVLIPLAMLILAGLNLLAQNVPWWATATVVLVFVVLSLIELIPALMRAYRALRTWLQHRAAARRYAVSVRQFLTTLSPSLERDRVGTVFSVLKSAVSFDQGKGQVKPDYVHLTTLQYWLRSVDSRLDDSGRKNFDAVCDELMKAVLQYHRLCEQAHHEIEALIISGQLTEQNLRNLKQEWNNARDKHNQTIKVWEDLAKNINREAAARITFDNFELLKTIG